MSETCRVVPPPAPTEGVIAERRSQRSRDFREALRDMWEQERQARAGWLIREHSLLEQVEQLTGERHRLTQENRALRERLAQPQRLRLAAERPSTPDGGEASYSANDGSAPAVDAGGPSVSSPSLHSLPTDARPRSIPRERGAEQDNADAL